MEVLLEEATSIEGEEGKSTSEEEAIQDQITEQRARKNHRLRGLRKKR